MGKDWKEIKLENDDLEMDCDEQNCNKYANVTKILTVRFSKTKMMSLFVLCKQFVN
jgi:hypothetical protein